MNHSRKANADATRVAISASQELFRTGLRALLELQDHVEVVGDTACPHEIERIVHHHQPDVAVIDASILGPSGCDLIDRARLTSPDTRFLLVSSSDAPSEVVRLFETGANGVIGRDAHLDDLLSGIACLMNGDRYLDPSLGAQLAQCHEQSGMLSEHETDIVRFIALGYTNTDIAQSLHVSVRTVETYRANIMSKLSLGSRMDLVRWALDARVIGPSIQQAS